MNNKVLLLVLSVLAITACGNVSTTSTPSSSTITPTTTTTKPTSSSTNAPTSTLTTSRPTSPSTSQTKPTALNSYKIAYLSSSLNDEDAVSIELSCEDGVVGLNGIITANIKGIYKENLFCPSGQKRFH